jgi:hypothetical protein
MDTYLLAWNPKRRPWVDLATATHDCARPDYPRGCVKCGGDCRAPSLQAVPRYAAFSANLPSTKRLSSKTNWHRLLPVIRRQCPASLSTTLYTR